MVVAAEDRLRDAARQLVAVDNERIGARFIEADHRGDAIGEQREAAGDHAGVGAVRPHGGDQRAGARRQSDALFYHLVDRRDRQALEQGDPFAQRRLEGNLAAHGALGDRRHVRFQADVIGEFVDAFLLDHGRIHVGQKQLLAAVGGRLQNDIEGGVER